MLPCIITRLSFPSVRPPSPNYAANHLRPNASSPGHPHGLIQDFPRHDTHSHRALDYHGECSDLLLMRSACVECQTDRLEIQQFAGTGTLFSLAKRATNDGKVCAAAPHLNAVGLYR